MRLVEPTLIILTVECRTDRFTARVPGTLALSCLRSVPNKIAQAQQLVKSVKAFAQWQSTHAWLKDPPEGYEFPPVDILKSLDGISATLSAGGYASEYDFQLSMMNTITLAHDGHFSYIGDVFKVRMFLSNSKYVGSKPPR